MRSFGIKKFESPIHALDILKRGNELFQIGIPRESRLIRPL